MKIYEEGDATDFEDKTWCCEEFWEKLHEYGKEREFNYLMEDIFPDGTDITNFNDLLRFDQDWLLEQLGIDEEEEEEEEEGEEQ